MNLNQANKEYIANALDVVTSDAYRKYIVPMISDTRDRYVIQIVKSNDNDDKYRGVVLGLDNVLDLERALRERLSELNSLEVTR